MRLNRLCEQATLIRYYNKLIEWAIIDLFWFVFVFTKSSCRNDYWLTYIIGYLHFCFFAFLHFCIYTFVRFLYTFTVRFTVTYIVWQNGIVCMLFVCLFFVWQTNCCTCYIFVVWVCVWFYVGFFCYMFIWFFRISM